MVVRSQEDLDWLAKHGFKLYGAYGDFWWKKGDVMVSYIASQHTWYAEHSSCTNTEGATLLRSPKEALKTLALRALSAIDAQGRAISIVRDGLLVAVDEIPELIDKEYFLGQIKNMDSDYKITI
mgnify:CR=1 FL=1